MKERRNWQGHKWCEFGTWMWITVCTITSRLVWDVRLRWAIVFALINGSKGKRKILLEFTFCFSDERKRTSLGRGKLLHFYLERNAGLITQMQLEWEKKVLLCFNLDYLLTQCCLLPKVQDFKTERFSPHKNRGKILAWKRQNHKKLLSNCSHLRSHILI